MKILALGATAALLGLASIASGAGEPRRLPRVALVANTVPLDEWQARARSDGMPHAAEAIREGLRARGWVDGENISIVHRSANGRLELLPAIFQELASLPVDVIVAIGPGVWGATKATKTIPIVMSATAAAVDIGLADSLARPGGNLTGLSFEARDEIIGKRLALLRQVNPRISRVAFLTDDEPDKGWRKIHQDAADAAGVKRLPTPSTSINDLERAFAAAVRAGAEAVLVTDGVWVHRSEYQRAINAAAARHRLPIIHSAEGGAETGGLMSYAIDSMAQYRRIPYFIDRILRGAKPSELPIEQPGNPQLVINLKVAKALGLALPQSVLIQADRVVE